MAIRFTVIQKAYQERLADGQPNDTTIIQTGSSSTAERDPGENVAKADSKVLSSEKVDGIKTLSQPWWPTPGQGRQPKAAQNSGSGLAEKFGKRTPVFLENWQVLHA